ncbi:MAG: MFS transporter [Bilophila wadsworthia]
MSGHPRTHQNAILRTYAGLLLISICVYTLMYAPQPMFNSVSRDFGVDKGSTGLLVSVFMLSLAVSPLCVGMLLSRIGVRRAILGASLLLGISGVGIWFAPSFLVLLGIRALQALLVPVVLTAVMSGIAVMFRHLDLNCACGLCDLQSCRFAVRSNYRRLGCADVRWRATLAVICFFFFLVLLFIRSIPEMRNASARLHSPREYLAVFKGRGVPSLFFAEACGIFVFAAIGNLIPFRMAELGQGHSEGLIGLMYFGYSVGLVASLSLAPLMRVFKTPTRLILFASAVYVASCLTLAVPSLWALFGGLWLIAFGEFVVHSISPGLINHQAMLSGHGDRGMVNGLFLSCYYFGGLLGSYIPGALYSGFGWFACYLCIQLVQVAAFFVLFRLHRTAPDLR